MNKRSKLAHLACAQKESISGLLTEKGFVRGASIVAFVGSGPVVGIHAENYVT